MTVDKLRFNLGNTNYDVPTKEYVDNLALNNGNNSNSDSNQSINLNDTPVGYITWQMALMPDYLKLDGTPLANASNDYTDLLEFARDNELITSDTTDNSLFKYDSTTDVLTLPDYISLVLQGGSTVETVAAGLPNIKGHSVAFAQGSNAVNDVNIVDGRAFSKYDSGAMYTSGPAESNYKRVIPTTLSNNDYVFDLIGFDASRSSSIYSDSVNTVQPPAIKLIPQIKYRKDTSNNILYNDTPIGTIISYMGNTAPKDYLVCDGQTYNIVDYKELAEYIKVQFGTYNKFGGNGTTTFAVPDLRGEFLRGTGTNSHTNQGKGASVGTHQDGTRQCRTSADASNTWLIFENSAWHWNEENADSTFGNGTRSFSKPIQIGNTETVTDGAYYTARPTNTSVLYCIKYTTSVLSTPENNYSTEEQRIGTWIDGKPLYQKTMTLPTESSSGMKTYHLDVQNVEFVMVDESASYLHDSNLNQYIPIQNIWDVGNSGGYVLRPTATEITFYWYRTIWYALPVYITLKYTKTTD